MQPKHHPPQARGRGDGSFGGASSSLDPAISGGSPRPPLSLSPRTPSLRTLSLQRSPRGRVNTDAMMLVSGGTCLPTTTAVPAATATRASSRSTPLWLLLQCGEGPQSRTKQRVRCVAGAHDLLTPATPCAQLLQREVRQAWRYEVPAGQCARPRADPAGPSRHHQRCATTYPTDDYSRESCLVALIGHARGPQDSHWPLCRLARRCFVRGALAQIPTHLAACGCLRSLTLPPKHTTSGGAILYRGLWNRAAADIKVMTNISGGSASTGMGGLASLPRTSRPTYLFVVSTYRRVYKTWASSSAARALVLGSTASSRLTLCADCTHCTHAGHVCEQLGQRGAQSIVFLALG